MTSVVEPLTSNRFITLGQVEKTFKRGPNAITVFRGLDMSIPKNDFVAIMGPSGSGKTTLLNLIGGIDRPTAGSILVGDERIEKLPGSALARWRAAHIGFVFQFYNLMAVLSARHNVELPLLLTNLSSRERLHRVSVALDLVGLADRASHYPSELSGGQQQRVAIARAIVSDPTILLCDEPTGDLDRSSADQVLEMLKTLNERLGKTIVMVTHDPRAAKYAHRTLHLDKGHFERQ
jgi:putative ABC transport system ATP-binding protein